MVRNTRNFITFLFVLSSGATRKLSLGGCKNKIWLYIFIIDFLKDKNIGCLLGVVRLVTDAVCTHYHLSSNNETI